jgi:putative phosphoesterase
MRIALVSDLHGNALALREALSRIAREGADRVICLGDVATLGPEPEQVLELLHECGAVCILGNHDEFLLRPDLVAGYTSVPVIVDAIDWCRSRLSAASLELIRGFRDSYELPLQDGSVLLTFHGTPSSNTTDLLATTDPETVERWIGAVNGQVLAGGHTHVQMLRQHRGRLLVNPGSVGMPFREVVAGAPPDILPHAEYAIVESGPNTLNVSLRRIALDKSQLREAALAIDFPLSSFLAAAYG